MALVPISMLSKINDSIAAALKRKLDANGVRNDATTTDAGYVLDARMGKTLGDRAEKLELKVGDLYFDTDSSGRWGYKSSKNGAVTPFRNPTGNAGAADVLSGKTFSSAKAENVAGSMPNNGAWTGKTTGKGNVTIPAGYHSGNGYVSGDGAYNTGISDADARVNENSASYKSGYANGTSEASQTIVAGLQKKSIGMNQYGSHSGSVSFASSGYVCIMGAIINKRQTAGGRTATLSVNVNGTGVGSASSTSNDGVEDGVALGNFCTGWIRYTANSGINASVGGSIERMAACVHVAFVPL